jgi:hypothetical protein
VQPFPGQGPSVQISPLGGDNPTFLRAGRTLYFRRGSQLFSAAWEERDGRFHVGSERLIATVSWPTMDYGTPFSPAGDGRVLALVTAEAPKPPRVTVVIGWAQTLLSR